MHEERGGQRELWETQKGRMLSGAGLGTADLGWSPLHPLGSDMGCWREPS